MTAKAGTLHYSSAVHTIFVFFLPQHAGMSSRVFIDRDVSAILVAQCLHVTPLVLCHAHLAQLVLLVNLPCLGLYNAFPRNVVQAVLELVALLGQPERVSFSAAKRKKPQRL